MYEAARLNNLEIEVHRLKALYYQQRFAAADNGATTDAGVDFIVDNFDTKDIDGLGAYWTPLESWNSFSIRSHRAVPVASNSTASLVMAEIFSFFDPAKSVTSTVKGPLLIPQGMSYTQKMSSPDITVKITFDGPPAPILKAFGLASDNVQQVYIYDAFAAGFGIYVKSGSGARAGCWGHAPRSPDQGAPSVIPAKILFGTYTNTNAEFATALTKFTAAEDPAFGRTLQASFPAATDLIPSAVVAGSNVMTFVGVGSTLTITLNGVTLFSGTSTLAVARDFVGMLSPLSDFLSILDFYGLTPFGISQFKAWRSDKTEPANGESGHGTYDATTSTPRWTDIYHKSVLDADGNITGYTYART